MNSLFLSPKYSLSLSLLVNSLDSCLSWAAFEGGAGVKDKNLILTCCFSLSVLFSVTCKLLLPVVLCSSFDSTVTLFWFSSSILFSVLLSLILLLNLSHSFCLSNLLTMTSTAGRLTRFLTVDYHLLELGRLLLLVHF